MTTTTAREKSSKSEATKPREFSFKGNLAEAQQLYKVKNKAQYVRFNDHQNLLYKRALMGLKYYTPEEVSKMKDKKRDNISRICRKTQKVLNLWKQEICSDTANVIFGTLFPNSPLVKDMLSPTFRNIQDQGFTNTLSFKDLGIGNTQIAEKLMEEGILPKNFFELEDKEQGKLGGL